MTKKEYAIIVAAGRGTRFGGSTPKQFLELDGKPVLLHTLEAFFRYSPHILVVLVLAEHDVATWNEIKDKYAFQRAVTLVNGGATRFDSVKAGLQRIEDDSLVAIHDGVRPLISEEIIAASFRTAGIHGTAVAAVKLKDSIRRVFPDPSLDRSESVDRSVYRLVQTPQTFHASLIKAAYAAEKNSLLTDDASVVERAGHQITLIDGSYDNLKITSPHDLKIAEALMAGQRKRRPEVSG